MDRNGNGPTSVNPPPQFDSLQLALDFAIVTGAELRLPVFVFLMRMASLELDLAFGIETIENAESDGELSCGLPPKNQIGEN